MDQRVQMAIPGQAAPNIKRVTCYLCETQKLPWAVIDTIPGLPDGNHVCRSCVNFEGIDRISDVIVETVRQKEAYARSQIPNGRDALYGNAPKTSGLSGRELLRKQMNESRNMDPNRVREVARHPRPEPPRPLQRPPGTQTVVTPFTNNGNRFIPKIPTHANMTALPPQLNPSAVAHGAMMANDFTRRAPVNVARTSAGNMIPVMNPSPVTSYHDAIPKSIPHHSQQAIPQPIPHPTAAGRIPKAVARSIEGQIASIQHQSPSPLTVQTLVKECYILFPAMNSLKDLLNKCAPFRVRFHKDSTIRGRVIQFNTKNELRVYIEYPIGSMKIFKSVQSVAHQMALDAVGGNMEKMTPISGNGYKDIHYEVKHRSDDWRFLSDLLTEGVRRFQEPVQTEMLPTKYSDPNAPTPPVNAETGDSDQGSDNEIEVVQPSPAPIKRPHLNSESDGPERKWPRPEDRDPRASASPKAPPSQKSNSPHAGSPDSNMNGRTDNAQLLCHLCKNRLEASHFVQCPSQQLHRFCFPCCQRTIRRSLNDNPTTEVFCPSGVRCAIAGSENPWAFMQAEIETILDRASHVASSQSELANS
ncbi:unnamed protein product [Oikopleura dioica]|uniref:Uncharacterized protein n=1 Tax=Oikopleura dioica TaxID=34765 RepID=E4YHG4_OIKDI|nr:unnamed protein product [Oikopleura dioica]